MDAHAALSMTLSFNNVITQEFKIKKTPPWAVRKRF